MKNMGNKISPKSLGALVVAILLGLTFWLVTDDPGKANFYDPGFAQSKTKDSCASCHAGGELIGNIGSKKSFLISEKTYLSVEDVIDDVMIPQFLKGKPIGKDSQEMKDLVTYLKSFSN